MFIAITDVDKIAQLNNQLGTKLKKFLGHSERRTITSPGGKYSSLVYFETRGGESKRCWASGKAQSNKLKNYFLFGRPGAEGLLNIAVQINFPSEKYSKAISGVFVHDETGSVYIAHRGKLTGPGGGFEAKKVLDRLASSEQVIEGDDIRRLAIVAGLDSPNLIPDIYRFANECRDIVALLAFEREWDFEQQTPEKASRKGQVEKNNQAQRQIHQAMKIGKYFDEFCGESVRRPIALGKRVVTHGAIVNSLATSLKNKAELRKSAAIDLAAITEEFLDLYEVKTSASTTDLYTGVGQLLIHGDALSGMKSTEGLVVRYFLVLPSRPRKNLETSISGKYKINIVLYSETATGYKFN